MKNQNKHKKGSEYIPNQNAQKRIELIKQLSDKDATLYAKEQNQKMASIRKEPDQNNNKKIPNK